MTLFKIMGSSRASLVILLLLSSPAPSAADENPYVGTWELISVKAIGADGSIDDAPYGPNPHGYITYTGDGYMTVLFSFGDRPHINGTWRTAPAPDRAQAFATVLGYAGTYSVDGDRMTHHVTVSTDPNRVGTSISRSIVLDEDTITLTTPAIDLGESAKRYSLTWRRVEKRSGFIAMSPDASLHRSPDASGTGPAPRATPSLAAAATVKLPTVASFFDETCHGCL